ncbi:MAG: putative toxin-antitoxin system toxin component, PIN family [Chloroflexota bacterium]|nr:putative toxin-antitoxin system toxin component, PIN family [Chloroflexota bacterium]
MTKLRAVLDTNVVIAAHLSSNPRSPTQELIRRWRAGEFAQIYSDATLAELHEKLIAKGIESQSADKYIADLLLLGEWTRVDQNDVLPVIVDDPDDDWILACAVKGQVDYLVTYDPHLLKLGDKHKGVHICDGLHFLYVVRGDTPSSENKSK